MPISLFWMAWTSYRSISIWSSIAASVMFGHAGVLAFTTTYMYLIDTYEKYAASALVFATLSRYFFSGGMVVVATPFYQNVGHHWTLTILGCVSLLLTPIPYVFYRYGHIIRLKSRFAVTSKNGQNNGQWEAPVSVGTPPNEEDRQRRSGFRHQRHRDSKSLLPRTLGRGRAEQRHQRHQAS